MIGYSKEQIVGAIKLTFPLEVVSEYYEMPNGEVLPVKDEEKAVHVQNQLIDDFFRNLDFPNLPKSI